MVSVDVALQALPVGCHVAAGLLADVAGQLVLKKHEVEISQWYRNL
jgi:hypothetical protein